MNEWTIGGCSPGFLAGTGCVADIIQSDLEGGCNISGAIQLKSCFKTTYADIQVHAIGLADNEQRVTREIYRCSQVAESAEPVT
jgi:hypothetical protein